LLKFNKDGPQREELTPIFLQARKQSAKRLTSQHRFDLPKDVAVRQLQTLFLLVKTGSFSTDYRCADCLRSSANLLTFLCFFRFSSPYPLPLN
jgi:hypothetical protein